MDAVKLFLKQYEPWSSSSSLHRAHGQYIIMWPIVTWCASRYPAGLEMGSGLGIKLLERWKVSEFCHSGSQLLLAKVSAGLEMTVCVYVCVCVCVCM